MRKGIVLALLLSLVAPMVSGCLVAAAGGAGYVIGKHHEKKKEERREEAKD